VKDQRKAESEQSKPVRHVNVPLQFDNVLVAESLQFVFTGVRKHRKYVGR